MRWIRRKLHFPGSTPSLPWVWVASWVVFVLGAAITLSIKFWDWLGGGESGSTTIRNLGLIIAAVIGLPIAIWRSILAQRQAETAQRSLLNERYQKGAEMLGSEVLSVRLGGIYALAQLAREYPKQYHTPIMSLLCFLACNPPKLRKATADKEPRADVQAIMQEIATRNEAQLRVENPVRTLSGACLEGIDVSKGNLSGLFLDGVSLKRAILHGTNLSGAFMFGACLEEASLISANLESVWLEDADLTGASLYRANLRNASLRDANLTKADLRGAKLKGCSGLTQKQVDQTRAWTGILPRLEGVVDADTGKPLVWHTRSGVDDLKGDKDQK